MSVSKMETVIKPFDLRSVVLIFRGQTPLLCNRINADVEAILDGKGKKTSAGPSSPEKSVEELAYRDKAGCWVFPACGVKKALIRAGSLTTMKMTDLRTSLDISVEDVPILASQPTVVTHTARKDKKGLIRVQRAEFGLPWIMRVPVAYVEGRMGAEDVAALAGIAGFGVGLGCWRPENNGSYGKFSVEMEVSS